MKDEEFELRLVQAVRPMVTEIVAPGVAREATDVAGVRRRALADHGTLMVALAVVVATALAAAVGFPGLVGSIGRDNSAHQAAGAAAGGPRITTQDGQVFVRRSADGANLELVLQKDVATTLVLASEAVPTPQANTSVMNVNGVTCPAATGLAQQYYVFGLTTASGKLVLHGVTGQAARSDSGLYVIAIDARSLPEGPGGWFTIGPNGDGGGVPRSTFLDWLPNKGDRTAAGCYQS